ncbi:hypothetical protein [Algoriphagus sp.]|uniref:hypothetical protein n=1 Tax=Algoriphagus sp. TaxID=1872435 RepID=UPI00391DCA79
MNLISKFLLFFVFTYLVSSALVAQNSNKEWQVGYFAPYLSNMGGTVGYAFDLKELGDNSTEQRKSKQRLQILTQLGYFAQTNVSHNFLLNPELVYRWNKSDKRFFLTSSVGLGYLLAFQRQDGTLNLGTGKIIYRYDDLHYFLPSLNIGLGVDPKKHLGFYFKATYGRKLSIQNANAAFVGISTGLIVTFNSKK